MSLANAAPSARPRQPTNVSLSGTLLAEARALNVNVSRACEHGLASAVAEARRREWLDQNADAIASSNAFVERQGLPLASARRF